MWIGSKWILAGDNITSGANTGYSLFSSTDGINWSPIGTTNMFAVATYAIGYSGGTLSLIHI